MNYKPKKVLVVDDDPGIIKFIAKLLESWGYLAMEAKNGQEALEVLGAQNGHQDPVDLVILDVNMPVMNGFETIARMKESSNLRSIPVIFLTGQRDEEGLVKNMRIRGQSYIQKPFQAEILRSLVASLLTVYD